MNDANRSLEQVLAAEREVQRLPSDIAKGDVFRIMLSESESGSSGILLLLPNSEILEHTHVDDWEQYTFSDSHIETCNVGDSHKLKNDTGDLMVVHFENRQQIMTTKVLQIKSKFKIELQKEKSD